ncbi:MAG TPA: FliH/SctL family protein [Silvibacterium sp.]|nr:FliH/SctL family protein [Silvibacterium sp.]
MLGQSKAKIQLMEYRAILAATLGQTTVPGELEVHGDERSEPAQADLEARIRELKEEQEQCEQTFRTRLNAVRKEAYETGRKSQENEHSAALAAASGHLAEALEEFRLDRDRYLAQVEREVVRLALEIAERILHRQAQMDPLLLSGAVRVALGQLAETTEVRLKVPPGEREMWAEMLRLMPNLPLRPELAVDERMSTGECTIETHLGSVDIGVRAQLAEIERGFFDLLDHRDQITSASQAAGR